MKKAERAIISLTDKSGIEGFAKELEALGIEILSTGGTAKKMRESGIAVKDVAEFTGFPEMLDGRVKTLHPKVQRAANMRILIDMRGYVAVAGGCFFHRSSDLGIGELRRKERPFLG